MARRGFPLCPSGVHIRPSLRLEYSDHKLVAMLEHDSGLYILTTPYRRRA